MFAGRPLTWAARPADAYLMEDRPTTCDARGCTEPAAPHATYWVPGQPWFHLCRAHWEMVGEGRQELRRLLGLAPDGPDAE